MPDTRPNLLWFCTDQQRFDTIGGLNNPLCRTPRLDAFMARATTFTHAFAQSPICTPSRASFLTGRYPRICGGRQNGQATFAEYHRLLPRALADAGWHCGLAGKLHLTVCAGTSEKASRGRDGYANFWWSHHPKPDWPDNDYARWLAERGTSWGEHYRVPPGAGHAYAGMPAELHQTTWCAERAIEHIDQAGEAPWMMSVNVFDPHHPFDPPREYLDRYDPDTLPLPTYREGEWDDKSPYQVIDHRGGYGGGGLSPAGLTARQQREVTAAYYAMIELIDDQFGRLLDHLDATGQRERTIVIFMSDHGELLGDHGIYWKGPHFYDPAVRVPLMISWPGVFREGQIRDDLVELVDLAPTVHQALGLEPAEFHQGRGLVSLLEGGAGPGREDVYAEYHNAMPSHRRAIDQQPFAEMLRTRDHKIVVYHGIDAGELYDLNADPDELENLWHRADCRELRDRLLRRLFDRVVFALDPCPPRVGIF